MQRDLQTPAMGSDEWLQEARIASKWARDGYAGVIAETAAKRLIWFVAKGRPPRYGVQNRENFGLWTLETASRSAAHVRRVLSDGPAHKQNAQLAAALDAVAECADDYNGPKPVFWSGQSEDEMPPAARQRLAEGRRDGSAVSPRRGHRKRLSGPRSGSQALARPQAAQPFRLPDG